MDHPDYHCCFDPAARDLSVRTSHGRVLLPLLIAVTVLTITAMGVWLISKPVTPPVPATFAILSLLRSEQVQLLVTDRLVEQINLFIDDSTLALGCRKGLLTAPARVYFGIDVAKIGPGDIDVRTVPIIVHVPEPEVIDIAVDSEAVQFMTKMSGLNVINDYLNNRNLREDLLHKLQRQAVCQLQSRGALPDRAALVARLNEQSGRLFAGSPVPIRFQ